MKVSGEFRAADALSTRVATDSAIQEALDRLGERIGGNPDLAVVFFSHHHAPRAEALSQAIRETLHPDSLVGCSASGVIGERREVEEGPGVALWALRAPGARAQAFHLQFERHGDNGVVRGWPQLDDRASAVLVVDPFSFPLDPFLSSLRQRGRAPTLIGGVASGGRRPEENRLLCDDQVETQGAVGFVLDGSVALEPIVSQGCRPVGGPLQVTRSERNVIYELSGQPAYQTLNGVLRGLEEAEQSRFRRAPQVGLKAVQSSGEMGSGGYLIRGIVGVDEASGAVAISDLAPQGLTLRFHTRDDVTAHEDLESMLSFASALYPGAPGALLFTCNGRGHQLFRRPDHDVSVAREYFPRLAVAGMFAAGEIGSVCGLPYIHGFTASMGLLVPRGE